ncbi:metal-binding protein [Gloeocapsopsis dulcis]|uniref:Metal-binding protein n=1 Tax=Gloeocapsopsis dulcis AAB1 = 1H9 TaxID=1433147 RepID=A0A6N8FVQ3_9CHRO|nr:metal-binding protein [Gloeocapsopsis dulcis]MUL36237.1 metal-binding protein [Gloeocapsopsis dulcis AAB1 = 1H9]WNN89650.1 metal-binding protein [Gloeocapsopsis dulcis]
MPSGRTHDRITLWGLPLITSLTFFQTQSGNLTLIMAGAYLFSGLMFGPDLDLYSRQYQRWGFLRWIWLPYQKVLRHRSIFSHGLLIGTTLRVLYLSVWLALVGIFVLGVAHLIWGVELSWQQLITESRRSLTQNAAEWFYLFLGLELGAMSHSLSDWSSSAYKRLQQNRAKMKKRKGSSTQLKRRK